MPKEGEYRYLRLAWKSRGARGVMIELADNGSFPPNNKPIRTYYSGQNTTGWVSNELSPINPEDWTVVTIDLWKDNGYFTLTGLAFTVMDGPASYDKIQLLRNVEGILE